MIRKWICLLVLLFAGRRLSARDIDSIYSFLNETIHMSVMESFDVRSDWGIFLLSKPYIYDEALCSLITADPQQPDKIFTKVPEAVLQELRIKCNQLDADWQRRFHWEQARISKFIVVSGYNDTIKRQRLNALLLNKRERKEAGAYIREWNSSVVEERLINYSGIPLFTGDGCYALVVRGQNAGSSGWDSLFIYQRTEDGWKILDSIRLSVI